MINVNWLRLLLCMAIFAPVSFVAQKYLNVPISNATVAGLGVLVGTFCIRGKRQQR